jgi:hypothetical protein
MIGILSANQIAATPAGLVKVERPFSRKAVVQVAQIKRFSTSAFGHKRTLAAKKLVNNSLS